MQIMPWHIAHWDKLVSSVRATRLPHALLFAGAEGVGKAQLVKAFSQYLLCHQPTNGACGQCRACHLFTLGHHPDYRVLGEKDGAISIDEIRDIIPFLAHSAHFEGKKIVTLLNIDSMQPAASNALLKTLEEPQENAHLFLTCRDVHALLPTLRSRCMVVRLALPERDDALQWLEKTLPSIEKKSLNLALSLAGGAPLKAEKSLVAGLEDKWQDTLFEAFFVHHDFLIPKEIQSTVTEDLHALLHLLCYWLADCVRCAFGVESESPYSPDKISAMQEKVEKIEKIQLFLFYDKVKEAIMMLRKIPGLNKQLLLEHLFYEWHQLST